MNTLNLLSAMVQFGDALYFYEKFDFTLNVFQKFVNTKRKDGKRDTRQAYIDFILAVFSSIPVEYAADFASKQFIFQILKRVTEDSTESILATLDSLERICLNQSLKRSDCTQIFNQYVLTQLLKLFDREEVCERLMSFFINCCATLNQGICFKDNGWTCSNLVHSKVLFKLLPSLTPLRSIHHKHLLLRILEVNPELVVKWNALVKTEAFLPSLSADYFKVLGLYCDIAMLPIPSINDGDEIVLNIFPKNLTRLHLSKGLQHKSDLVRYQTLILLICLLKRYKKVINVIRLSPNDRLDLFKLFPDFQLLLLNVSRLEKNSKLCDLFKPRLMQAVHLYLYCGLSGEFNWRKFEAYNEVESYWRLKILEQVSDFNFNKPEEFDSLLGNKKILSNVLKASLVFFHSNPKEIEAVTKMESFPLSVFLKSVKNCVLISDRIGEYMLTVPHFTHRSPTSPFTVLLCQEYTSYGVEILNLIEWDDVDLENTIGLFEYLMLDTRYISILKEIQAKGPKTIEEKFDLSCDPIEFQALSKEFCCKKLKESMNIRITDRNLAMFKLLSIRSNSEKICKKILKNFQFEPCFYELAECIITEYEIELKSKTVSQLYAQENCIELLRLLSHFPSSSVLDCDLFKPLPSTFWDEQRQILGTILLSLKNIPIQLLLICYEASHQQIDIAIKRYLRKQTTLDQTVWLFGRNSYLIHKSQSDLDLGKASDHCLSSLDKRRMISNDYDFEFIFPLLCRLMEHDFDVELFLKSNSLSFLFNYVSDPNLEIRTQALSLIHTFYLALDASDYVHKNQLLVFLDFIRTAITATIPKIISVFCVKAIPIITNPSDQLYIQMNQFVLQRPSIDMTDIPLFYSMFQSHRKDVVWILDLIIEGMDGTDLSVFNRRHVFDLVLVLNANTADSVIKEKTYKVIAEAERVFKLDFENWKRMNA